MQIKVNIEDREVKENLKRLQAKLSDMTPVMRDIGEIIRTSIERNFEAQGRPSRWEPSARAWLKGGQTLTDRGRLKGSFTVRAFPDRAVVGTNVKYAAAHQFGFSGTVNISEHIRSVSSRNEYEKYQAWSEKKGAMTNRKRKIAHGIGHVRAHTRRLHLPARPFMMIQDEDWGVIKQTILRHLEKG